jgi:hydroxypyruvate isomerase
MKNTHTRRSALKNMALAAGAVTLPVMKAAANTSFSSPALAATPFRHSVCRWCFGKIPLEELCEKVKPMGISSIELTTPEEWKTLKNYGLTCAVGTETWASLTHGYNEPGLHKKLNERYMELVKKAAEAGIPNVIVFSGNRKGISDAIGLEHCATGLDPLVKFAEKQGVTIIMELLNSRVDHYDYQCDHTAWGVALVEKIGSQRFKLLYDIYHMQIMEGDVIATIRNHVDYIGHFHTAGVPGRNEIDDTQELYYPAIMKAIAGTGFSGFVAQEFIPKAADGLASLKKAVDICSV